MVTDEQAHLMRRLRGKRLCRDVLGVWYIEPGGGHADARAVDRLLALGMVVPVDGGLFGDRPQQYRARNVKERFKVE